MTTPTGNKIIDSVLWGGWKWVNTTGAPVHLTYAFSDTYSTWLTAEKTAFRQALKAFSKVSKISFSEVSNESDANLLEHALTNAQMSTGSGITLGRHEPPEYATVNSSGVWQEDGYYNWEAWSYPSNGLGYDPTGLVKGGYGFTTILHELGHALGLGHPHDTSGGVGFLMPTVSAPTDYGDKNLNQGLFTVMSYNRGWADVQDPRGNNLSAYGYNKGLSALDIAAIQYLYGADRKSNDGNSTYILKDKGSWMAIWDTGGVDTIRYDGWGDAVINLASATLTNKVGGGGMPSYIKNSATESYYGGYTIAGDFMNVLRNKASERGVIIENANGGYGDDVLKGNSVGNRLVGFFGDDRLFGKDGNDTLSGNSGDDRLVGGKGHDKLFGGNGKDLISAGGGADVLKGGRGWDTLTGGAGQDAFHFGSSEGRDTITDFSNDFDTLMLSRSLWSGHLTKAQVVNRFADAVGGKVVFTFDGGEVLKVEGVSNPNALIDDIVFT